VETDDHQPAGVAVGVSRVEQAVGERKYHVKAVEFTVHLDPERLEDFGGGVIWGASPRAPHGLPDDTGELGGRPQRLAGARGHDGPRDAPRPGLFAVFEEERCERRFIPGVHDVGGCWAAGRWVHAHVEGAFEGEGESPVGALDLERGEAQVEEDAIGGRDTCFRGDPVEFAEVRVDEADPPPKRCQPRARELQRLGVLVDAEESSAWSEPAGDGLGVAAEPGGAVDVGAVLADVEPVEGFVEEDRLVDGERGCHDDHVTLLPLSWRPLRQSRRLRFRREHACGMPPAPRRPPRSRFRCGARRRRL